MERFRLSDVPFDTATLRAELLDARVGAYASFEGWIRDHNDGRHVHGLHYQAYATLAETEGNRIVDTAIIAGTMAVKRTHDLIPFCHPLPIDGCGLTIDWINETSLRIECVVRTTHRTGVEMEALTGATVAALTVYDMCKALSHAIVIGPARLLGKRGGKRDFGRTSA